MKRFCLAILALVITSALVFSLSLTPSIAQAPDTLDQGTSATALAYHGYLTQAGVPVSEACDLQFRVWSAQAGGKPVADTLQRTGVAVSGGYFDVTDLSFKATLPPDSWLEVALRCPGVSGGYVTLQPRQAIIKLPAGGYTVSLPETPAQVAGTADAGPALSGGAFSLVPLALPPSTAWLIGGNAGTITGANFLGTIDNVPLDLRVQNQRALRLVPNASSPSIIGGFSGNNVKLGVVGGIVAGGGASGKKNLVTDDFGTVSGGANNIAGNNLSPTTDKPYATVGGGLSNQATAMGATIGGGMANTAGGWRATIAGGEQNAAGDFGTIAGGYLNVAQGYFATIGGGTANTASSPYTTIGGGTGNTANYDYATIGGGEQNTNTGWDSVIGGGTGNTAGYAASTIAGGRKNTASNAYSTVAGGNRNTASGWYSTVGGGDYNTSSAWMSTVAGGDFNTAGGDNSFVGGGLGNLAQGMTSTIAGGQFVTVTGKAAAVGGGSWITVTADFATVGGGEANSALGSHATIPGGASNQAAGNFSFAAGYHAKANANGCFVWADSTDADFACNTQDMFAVRANGGVSLTVNGAWVNIYKDATNVISTSTGAALSSGGTWTNSSDKNLKTNVAPLDGQQVLDKLSSLPIDTWSYKNEDPSILHAGPMAQDFYAAFGLGADNTHIATVDADGVALAAIQALNKEVNDLRAQNTVLQSQNAALEQRLSALEARIDSGSPARPINNSTSLLFGVAGLLTFSVAGAVVLRRSSP